MKVIFPKDHNPEFDMLPKKAQAKLTAEAKKRKMTVSQLIEFMKLGPSYVIDDFFEEFHSEMGIKRYVKNPMARPKPKP